jgi:hypothetical protein
MEKEKNKKLLIIALVVAISCCCVLLLPQVRFFIVKIVEMVLGRDLRDPGKWTNLLLSYSLYAILCFGVILIFLNKFYIKINKLYSIFNRHSDKIADLLLFFTVIILELVFFRGMIFYTDNVKGGMIDGRLLAFILEHWYKVFCGQEAVRDLSMFYPVKNTLGYSDALFLLSLPYSFLRAIGYQWMTAYQLTMIGVHFFGGLCLAWFLRKSLKLPFIACVIGLIIGNYSNSYYIRVAHLQYVTISLIPLLFILLKNFYNCFNPDDTKMRKIYGILSVFLFAGIISTGFYTGFFTALFLLILHIVIAVYLFKSKFFKVKQILEILQTYKLEILMYIVCAIIALLPFFWIYMPVYNKVGARIWQDIIFYMPHWYDFFNVSPHNLLWFFLNSNYWFMVGYPLITGILLIVVCSFYIKRYFNTFSSANNINFYITIGFSFTIAVVSLFILRFDILNKSFSLWFLIYKLIPGASAIRFVSGFNVFLTLPAGILIAIFLSERMRFSDKMPVNKPLLACAVLVVLIFCEHQNRLIFSEWTKSSTDIYLDSISPPPDDCDSFFFVNNNNFSDPHLHQVDAMMIANRFNIKTINGWSGQIPSNFLPMWDMETNKNYTDLLHWINEYNMDNVYLYDHKNDNWILCTENSLEEFQSKNQKHFDSIDS